MLIYLTLIADPRDRQDFEELYTRYQGLLFYVARKVLASDKDAEDAVHNAFLSIAENMDKVARLDEDQRRAYLVTTAERKAIDLCRRRTRRPTVPLEEEAAGLTVPYHGENGLARCILMLPARYRQFVLLKYDQGYTTKEVAKMMDLTLAAAYKLDQRAKAKLEELCRKEGVL